MIKMIIRKIVVFISMEETPDVSVREALELINSPFLICMQFLYINNIQTILFL